VGEGEFELVGGESAEVPIEGGDLPRPESSYLATGGLKQQAACHHVPRTVQSKSSERIEPKASIVCTSNGRVGTQVV